MRNTQKRIVVFLTAWIIASSVTILADTTDFGSKGVDSARNMSLEDMLVHALQDEYLAQAEYRLIISQYGSMRPFSNILRAEGNHIAWTIELMEKYGFSIPENTANKHIVLPKDLKSALKTGVDAEVANIAMYDKFLTQKLPNDVRALFLELQNGSRNHLRAFQNNLNRYR